MSNYLSLLLIILPVWAFAGNMLVLIAVYKEKMLHTITNYFVANLAIADIMLASLAMPFHIYVSVNESWNLGDIFCDISLGIDCCTAIASKFTLVAISIDRYIAVTKPLKYRSLQLKYYKQKLFTLIISILWIIAFGISIPIAFGLNTHPERITTICTFYNPRYIIIASVFTFWFPLVILLLIYVLIVRAISRHIKKSVPQQQQIASENPSGTISNISASFVSEFNYNNNLTLSSPPISTMDLSLRADETNQDIERSSASGQAVSGRRSERKATITIVIVLTAFFVCWSPFYISSLVQFVCHRITPNTKIDYHYWHQVFLYTGWCGYFNSCVNFIIYGYFNPMFKKVYKKYFSMISVLCRKTY